MVNLVVDLPKSIAASLLSSYLDDRAISRLDRAFCVVGSRQQFLEILRSGEFARKGNRLIGHCPDATPAGTLSYMRWCVARSVRISSMHWVYELQDFDQAVFEPFMTLVSPHLTKLVVIQMQEHSLLKSEQPIRFGSLKDLTWLHSGRRTEELAVVLSTAHSLERFEFFGLYGFRMGRIDGPVCSHVKTLCVSGYMSLFDLSWLAGAFPNVQEMQVKLDWPTPPPGPLLDLIIQYPRLKRLTLSVKVRKPERVLQLDFALLAQGCRMLTHLMLESATSLTDADVHALCTYCTHLEHLQITDNAHITTASLQSMSTHLGNSLRHLEIKNCVEINTFEGLSGCKLLQYLDISTGGRLRSSAQNLDKLFESCTLLQEVWLYNRRVDNAALVALAHNCPHLRFISLENSVTFDTKSGLFVLAEHAKALRTLRATGTWFSEKVRSAFATTECELELVSEADSDSSSDEGEY